MRIAYRERYAKSEWILVDTKQNIAEERILSRQGHFYKGSNVNTATVSDECTDAKKQKVGKNSNDSRDNNEWEFQPVDFPHVILDGCDSISKNARRIVEVVRKMNEQRDVS